MLLPEEPVSEDEGFSEEPLTLQDLVQIEDDGFVDAVDMLFPSGMLEENVAEVPEESTLNQEVIDLTCHEDLEDSDVEPENAFAGADFELDYPEIPCHSCSACNFHRQSTGMSDACCALCYMRINADFVYGKFYKLWLMFIFFYFTWNLLRYFVFI